MKQDVQPVPGSTPSLPAAAVRREYQ